MPYPNEHACRLEDPQQFDRIRRATGAGTVEGKRIDHVIGIKDGKGTIQAVRYPLANGWEGQTDAARRHCDRRGGSFEAASGE